MAKALPELTSGQLESICRAMGDTSDGLTGSEIGRALTECGISDPGSGMTKWKRLYAALGERQGSDRSANAVAAFILRALEPARWAREPHRFQVMRDGLNEALVFAGLHLTEDGKLVRVDAATTLTEAQKRASRLRTELSRRQVHGDVLRFCTAEIIQKDYFHAVLEATKSLADKIRDMSGLDGDGAKLVDDAFGIGSKPYPILAFNSLHTQTERDEHTGLMYLMKGAFGAFRNPTAHAPRITWKMTEENAVDALTLLSMLHRCLDKAVRTPRIAAPQPLE